MSVIIVIVLILISVIVIVLSLTPITQPIIVHGMVINISTTYKDKDQAIELMYECNSRMIKLLEHLRAKYYIGATDDECGVACKTRRQAKEYADARATIEHLLRGFNYEAIHENIPSSVGNTAYSLDKGRTIMLCLRDVRPPHNIVDINTLMFVIIHEAAHIANWTEWGHGPLYWSIFKFLLREAARIGVYDPIDYARTPATYCSFHLDHNPLFDRTIQTAYQN
ncbi:MAG: hypothetical protein WC919_05670 [Candidatus Paceibacterota bacterium]